jgi:hypothetical protein
MAPMPDTTARSVIAVPGAVLCVLTRVETRGAAVTFRTGNVVLTTCELGAARRWAFCAAFALVAA